MVEPFGDTAGRPDPAPPGRVAAAAPTRSTKSPVQTPRTRTRNGRTPTPDTGRSHRTVDSGSWTSHARTLDVHPDTGRVDATEYSDRATSTADTGQTFRTTTTTRPPAGTPNRGPVDGTCCARQRRRLGNDEVPASARLPTALPGACSVALSAKPRPGALLSSDDFRVERRARGSGSSVMASAYADGCCRSTCGCRICIEYGCRLG